VRRRKRRRTSPPSQAPPEYLNRQELLALVPLSMSTIDKLEKAGIFPSRFVLSPTTRVAWKRREVVRFLERRAAKRVHAVCSPAAAQDRTSSTNREHSNR
jgi:predicted DNA-binding transcriptional regulator AlpA